LAKTIALVWFWFWFLWSPGRGFLRRRDKPFLLLTLLGLKLLLGLACGALSTRARFCFPSLTFFFFSPATFFFFSPAAFFF
jgi:hypothetical protein